MGLPPGRSVNVASWPDLGSRVDRLVGLSSSFLQSVDFLHKPILSLKEVKLIIACNNYILVFLSDNISEIDLYWLYDEVWYRYTPVPPLDIPRRFSY